jgi:beta-lactamase class D
MREAASEIALQDCIHREKSQIFGNVTRGTSLFSLWKASWLSGVVTLIVNTGSIVNADAAVLCTALADATSGQLLKAEGTCSRQVTPASTFKIAISLMGYDSGFLKNEHSPALPFRKGYPDWRPEWRTTTDPTGWIKNSVVWYSQQVTTHMGEAQFQRYVTAFRYGNENVSGNPGKHDGLTQAWLSSSLQISPLEQLAFLEKLVRRQLPIKPQAYEMTGRITAVGTIGAGWEFTERLEPAFRLQPMPPAMIIMALAGLLAGHQREPGRSCLHASSRMITRKRAQLAYGHATPS